MDTRDYTAITLVKLHMVALVSPDLTFLGEKDTALDNPPHNMAQQRLRTLYGTPF